MRFVAYIDGLNLYHALKRYDDERLRWLNVVDFAQSFIKPSHTLECVHYFSAWAKHKSHTGAYKRQQNYLEELQGVGVQLHMSNFKKKHRYCRNCDRSLRYPEEKETDVHIALKVLMDATDDKFDTALIFSADSDLIPVVTAVKKRHPKKRVHCVIAQHRVESSHDIRGACHDTHTFDKTHIANYTLPNNNPYPVDRGGQKGFLRS